MGIQMKPKMKEIKDRAALEADGRKLQRYVNIHGMFEKYKDQMYEQLDSSINKDLSSNSKMFRLLQGDVGSGKTIVALVSALSVINSNFQVALMAPTEILARQHYSLAKKLFPENISIELLSSKSENIDKKRIINELKWLIYKRK